MKYLLDGWCGISRKAIGEGLREPLDTVYGPWRGRRGLLEARCMQLDSKLEAKSSLVASAGMPPIP